MISDKKIETTREKLKYLIALNAPKGLKISDIQLTIDSYRDKSSIYQYDVDMKIEFPDFPGVHEVENHLRIIKNEISRLLETYRISKDAVLSTDELQGFQVFDPLILEMKTGYLDFSATETCTYRVLFNVLLD